jgi:deoxyribonuclease V
MQIKKLHSWDVTTAEARALQETLASQVKTSAALKSWDLVAAADVSYNKFAKPLYAAVVVVHAATLELVERVGVVGEAQFPYVPGLLSFRELPPVLVAFERLRTQPDVVLCDGQGYAHPRRVGLACHLGLWLGVPTIGCAKSWLLGEYDEPGPTRGQHTALIDRGEVVGAVVRTRDRVRPLFVSPGHLCDTPSSVAVVLAATAGYRLPVPARLAHTYVNEMRRAVGEGKPVPP